MDFFGIGPLELLLILIILIVVVGPEKVPEVARRLGRAVRAFRGATDHITREIDREVRGIKEDTRTGIGDDLRRIREDVKIDVGLDGDEKKPENGSTSAGEKGQG